MIKIYSDGEQIAFTAGDTFSLNITSADGFDQGDKLRFQVAENENEEFIIDKIFELNEGVFEIVLADEEKQKLQIGSYIYKLVITDETGTVVTRKSGELKVKWGA